MDIAMLIEIFGYIGSILVVISMLMSSIVKLRVINTVGSVISGIYAVICGAIPLALMNICLIIINVYNLLKLLKTKQVYDLVNGNADEALVKYFLDRYADDIKMYFSEFEKKDIYGKQAYIVCCNGNPAGVLLGEEKEGILNIMIDYTTPTYRDCSVGTYLFSKLKTKGIIKTVFKQSSSEAHIEYLKKMGFRKENDSYIKQFN